MAAAARPFHHGNLRQVLLDRAEDVLRERGIDALSLRELARDAGVSHGAPRSHFADRAALLDALAARGFDRLADSVEAVARTTEDHADALRELGRVQLDFSLQEGALADLMFAAKGAATDGAATDGAATNDVAPNGAAGTDGAADAAATNAAATNAAAPDAAPSNSSAVAAAAERMFHASSGIIEGAMSAIRGEPVDVLRTTLLMAATTQGIASLVTSGRVPRAMGDVLLDDAFAMYVHGSLPARA